MKFSKRRKLLLGIVGLCVILAVSSIVLWQSRPVAEAAVLDPHPGLVGWWRFDEGTGTIAGDSSGNGNNGAISGETWVTGRYGDALSFDGVSKHVEIPSSATLLPSNTITIEFWVEIASADINSNAYMGFVCRNTRTDGLQVIKDWGDGRVLFETPGVGSLVSTVALTPDVWNHVVCVLVSGSSATIYVNGQAAGSSSGWILPTTSMDYWIGQAAAGTVSPHLKGAVDEVHIYNRALSAAEVQRNYQLGPDFSSNVLATVPKGMTDFIATLSWQGTASINITIQSPSQTYTEDMMHVYQKTTYSTSGGTSSMLNIKRVEVSTTALTSDQNWHVTLTFDNAVNYQMSVEVQK